MSTKPPQTPAQRKAAERQRHKKAGRTAVTVHVRPEYVAEVLTDLRADPVLVESAPRRANVLARVEGSDRTRPPLLVHGHLDVVPADPADWSHPPFAGEVVDGYVWGRGAVDMKGFAAIALGLLPEMTRSPLRRPIHILLTRLFYILLVLHIAGALMHAVVWRDGLLSRMGLRLPLLHEVKHHAME